jgi:tetratricopeptide (TPR) repeat protein
MLFALGQLSLKDHKFSRVKPLLLLAYLALEGPKTRRFLAELFWPEATDPMNSLAVALAKLRKLGVAQNDETKAWVSLECDALALQQALRAGDWEAAKLYKGAFAEGINEAIGSELEDWVYEVRECLGQAVRQALLLLAQAKAVATQFVEAAALAEKAYSLPGAPPLEPEELPKVYQLLLAGNHPLGKVLEAEAAELGIGLSSIARAKELLRQGLPKEAIKELDKLPDHPGIPVLRMRALERAGLYKEAFESVHILSNEPSDLALKATLYYRLGQIEESQQWANQALAGGVEARAEAHNVLGAVALAKGDFEEAYAAFKRSAGLWLALGEESRRLGALSNAAVARARTGVAADKVFASIETSDMRIRAQILINLGKELERQNRLEEASLSYRQAEQTAQASGNLKQLALAQNNFGALLHIQKRADEARAYYHLAIASARSAGEANVLAMALGNLAELDSDVEVWKEAIAVCENAGNYDLAAQHKGLLEAFMGRSGQ